MKVAAALRRAKQPGFARSVGILTSGTMLANALGILTTPIVSRLYDPYDFGEFAVVLSVVTIVSALISLGMQSAVVKAKTDGAGRQVLTVALCSAAVLSASITAVALMLSPVARFAETSIPYVVVCLLVGTLGFLTSANGTLRSLANRRSANRVLFVNYLVGAVSTLIITVPLGLMGVGAIGLIAGSLGSMLICNAQMVLRLRPFSNWPALAEIRTVFRENRDFVRFQYPANLVETISAQAPRQALSLIFGSASVGLYAMTDKLLGIPLRLIGVPVGTVYFREAAQRDAAGENLTRFTGGVVVRIMTLAYVPIFALVLWGEPLFAWVLGADWAPAGALASVLIVQYVFSLTRQCVGSARVVLNRQSVNLAMSAVRLGVEVGALTVGALVTESAFGTLVWFSIASTMFYIFDMTVTFRMMGRSHWRYLGGALAYFGSVGAAWLLLVAL